jgi:hypothetical protein
MVVVESEEGGRVFLLIPLYTNGVAVLSMYTMVSSVYHENCTLSEMLNLIERDFEIDLDTVELSLVEVLIEKRVETGVIRLIKKEDG